MFSNNQGITLLSLCQSTGKTMWIPSWMWKSGPTLYPNKDPGALFIKTVFDVEKCLESRQVKGLLFSNATSDNLETG